MEVLFKKALPWMENDDDEFPATGYDNIIVNKILQLWNEEEGKGDEVVRLRAHPQESAESAGGITLFKDALGLQFAAGFGSVVKCKPRNRAIRPSIANRKAALIVLPIKRRWDGYGKCQTNCRNGEA